jgi:hypothetical protein
MLNSLEEMVHFKRSLFINDADVPLFLPADEKGQLFRILTETIIIIILKVKNLLFFVILTKKKIKKQKYNIINNT